MIKKIMILMLVFFPTSSFALDNEMSLRDEAQYNPKVLKKKKRTVTEGDLIQQKSGGWRSFLCAFFTSCLGIDEVNEEEKHKETKDLTADLRTPEAHINFTYGRFGVHIRTDQYVCGAGHVRFLDGRIDYEMSYKLDAAISKKALYDAKVRLRRDEVRRELFQKASRRWF